LNPNYFLGTPTYLSNLPLQPTYLPSTTQPIYLLHSTHPHLCSPTSPKLKNWAKLHYLGLGFRKQIVEQRGRSLPRFQIATFKVTNFFSCNL
jgi:hypothetical protein